MAPSLARDCFTFRERMHIKIKSFVLKAHNELWNILNNRNTPMRKYKFHSDEFW